MIGEKHTRTHTHAQENRGLPHDRQLKANPNKLLQHMHFKRGPFDFS